MITVEITAAVNLNGDLATFYLCFGGDFRTGPDDAPPSTAFAQRLLDPGSLGLHAYADGKITGGATALEAGQVTIANMDGEFDDWLNYSFEGRPVVIRSGPAGAPYPSGFSVLFSGTMDGLDDAGRDELGIRLRDRQYVLRVPALATQYGGTNVQGGSGLDGAPEDLQGKPKPRVFGTVFNVAPPQVNTGKLAYQVNDGPVLEITAVYDGGGPLTRGADYATSAAMQTASPSAGTYITCLAEGYFRLAATPQGEVTCDVTQGATAADRTTAQVLRRLVLLASDVPASDATDADAAALDAAFPAQVGIWINEAGTTLQGAMDAVAASVNAWYGFDGTGALRMGVLTEPAGDPSFDIQEYLVLGEGPARRPARDGGIPAWRVTGNYARNWTVQTSGLIGAATAARRAFVALQNRSVSEFDGGVKTQFLLAADVVLDGLMVFGADAQAEARRQLQLQNRRRDIFEVPVSVDDLPGALPFYMDLVSLTYSRYGLRHGRLFRLIGMRLQLADNIIVLQLWG